jgi:hypothetical protein
MKLGFGGAAMQSDDSLSCEVTDGRTDDHIREPVSIDVHS